MDDMNMNLAQMLLSPIELPDSDYSDAENFVGEDILDDPIMSLVFQSTKNNVYAAVESLRNFWHEKYIAAKIQAKEAEAALEYWDYRLLELGGELHIKRPDVIKTNANTSGLKYVHVIAAKGSSDAQAALGDYYIENGDPEVSLFWYRKAAAQGNKHATEMLHNRQSSIPPRNSNEATVEAQQISHLSMPVFDLRTTTT